jgi:hypothetical protein
MIRFLTDRKSAMFSASHFLLRKGFYTRYASLLSGHTIYSMQQSQQVRCMHFSLVRIKTKFCYDVTQMQTRVPHMTTPTNDRLNYELLVRKDVADVYENIRKV